jgi:hypothetical protein
LLSLEFTAIFVVDNLAVLDDVLELVVVTSGFGSLSMSMSGSGGSMSDGMLERDVRTLEDVVIDPVDRPVAVLLLVETDL